MPGYFSAADAAFEFCLTHIVLFYIRSPIYRHKGDDLAGSLTVGAGYRLRFSLPTVEPTFASAVWTGHWPGAEPLFMDASVRLKYYHFFFRAHLSEVV